MMDPDDSLYYGYFGPVNSMERTDITKRMNLLSDSNVYSISSPDILVDGHEYQTTLYTVPGG